MLPIRLRDLELQSLDSIEHLDDETGLPHSISRQSRYNFGDLNDSFKAILSLLTLYLFCYDFTVLVMSLCKSCDKTFILKDTLITAFNLVLHYLVLSTLINANNEVIPTIGFWQRQSWVALAVWMRMILTYLGQIKEFSWLVGLISYSCTSTVYFFIVFICGVTAFADSFNALDQKILLNGSRYENL